MVQMAHIDWGAENNILESTKLSEELFERSFKKLSFNI